MSGDGGGGDLALVDDRLEVTMMKLQSEPFGSRRVD